MCMRKLFFLLVICTFFVFANAQTYTSGLTATGTGTSTNVRLGGANPLLVNTTVDLSTFTFGFKTTALPSLFTILNNGRIGVGISPTSLFHLKAGTAAANTAPLKFTSGVNLSAPEAGTMEFNGTSLFFTPSTAPVTRRTIAFADLSNITSILGIANGGTGATTPTAALTNLLPVQTGLANRFLQTNGTSASWVAAGGTGTVTAFGFTNANGFTGTVATATTTPALTIGTTLNGLLRGNGTGLNTGQANLASEVSGILPFANGGTGLNTVGANGTVLTINAGVPTWLTPATSVSSQWTTSGNDIYYANLLGNIGISTSAPRYKLDLARIGGDNQEDFIALGVNNGPAIGSSTLLGGGIVWKANYPGYTKRSAGIVQTAEANSFRAGLAFFTNGTNDATTDWIERMRITKDGNIGIGTSSPSEKLHVVGNTFISGNITSPGSGSGSEKFGSSASVGANNFSLALGYNAITTGHESVALGYYAKAGLQSTAIGNNTQATGFASTMIGAGAVDNGVSYLTGIGASIYNPGYFSGGSYLNSGMINIGYNNISTGFNRTYLVGANLTADRDNQMLIGNGLAGGFLNDIVLGGGLSNNLAASYGPLSVRTTDGSGANSAGMPLSFKGGKSTGSASGGYLSFYTTPAGVSGSIANAEVERMRIDANGALSFNGSAGTAGQVLTSAGAGAAPTWATPAEGGSEGWGLTGNGGTNSAVNFIGTTDDKDVIFKRNGIQSGLLSGDQWNTSFGIGALNPLSLNPNGDGRGHNNAFGYEALHSNTNGWGNDAFGTQALYSNTTGVFNVAFGARSLYANYSGNDNIAVGAYSLKSNTTGYNNLAVGTSALYNNTLGKANIGLGVRVLEYNTIGDYNFGAGETTLHSNTSGMSNVGIAYQSLFANTTGNANIGIGQTALVSNISGNFNIGIGNSAGNNLTTGDDNIAIGNRATFPNTSGSGQLNIGNVIFGTGLTHNYNSETDPPIPNGNIGIGKISPIEKLDVNGNIYTNAKVLIGTLGLNTGTHSLAVNGSAIFTKAVVKLTTAPWPDYVFKPTYKLPSLKELEKYLLKNQHLPDVPSAAEVEKNGIDLGDNQTILLKKVEELTLYMIELNKKVEALAKENEALKKKINPTNQ